MADLPLHCSVDVDMERAVTDGINLREDVVRRIGATDKTIVLKQSIALLYFSLSLPYFFAECTSVGTITGHRRSTTV